MTPSGHHSNRRGMEFKLDGSLATREVARTRYLASARRSPGCSPLLPPLRATTAEERGTGAVWQVFGADSIFPRTLPTPLLSVITASAAEADCIADALSGDYDITRRGNKITVKQSSQLPDAIGALLSALEDCVIKNELPPVKVALNGRRYTMYPRTDA
jgi:hypothetical protein